MSEIRTTDQIHDDITNTTLGLGPTPTLGDLLSDRSASERDQRRRETYAALGRLWREMARAADREKMPGWTMLAAALLADDYDREAGRA